MVYLQCLYNERLVAAGTAAVLRLVQHLLSFPQQVVQIAHPLVCRTSLLHANARHIEIGGRERHAEIHRDAYKSGRARTRRGSIFLRFVLQRWQRITKVYPQKSAKPTKPAASAANNEVSRQAVANNHQNTESEKGFFGSIISAIKNIFR